MHHLDILGYQIIQKVHYGKTTILLFQDKLKTEEELQRCAPAVLSGP